MIRQSEITLPHFPRGFHLITNHILSGIGELPESGMLNLFIKHTSAALMINEKADSAVLWDFATSFDRLFPENVSLYAHVDEGADDMPAHLKAGISGSSVTIPVTSAKLNLGAWQGIYLCEFRNHGGLRKIVATILY